ncbi:methylenetetrahydrofolate reductase [NAD(P)H] [Pannonibacter sp. Q-1]|uniref:methylenetetrahydrofolate reductase [NAD(P)H] n=1 Tax=Pannonibacter phragmitetus TaxID=121719 RepID=UPI00067DCAA5|nr:methylenetetrahydrofolate reductase [NAD(P)H] [Pannonibacter phragmitetus]KND17634.1 5,10-methylenetetrahydrofolate reductase [Pannonibacter phragmitetus]MBA4205470.1 methylenetetrahydrofolate reductase [Polymorphum sp.]
MSTSTDARRSHSSESAPVKVSFEFFPPKTDKMEATLWSTIQKLETLSPSFVSVTYGAGGSTRERTHRTVERILKETPMLPAAHLTCVGASRADVDAVVQDYWDLGVRHIVALRGDPQEGVGTAYVPREDGYAYASDLVAGIKAIGDFEISVSGYPERHPESTDWQVEIDNLKRKIDAGASRVITQYFFDNNLFEAYLERIAKAGLSIPVVPGILPILNFDQVVKFSSGCGTTIPDWLSRRFAGLDDDAETRKLVGAAVAYEQVMDLVDRGISDFHFYTMNRAELTFALCHMLGLGQGETARQVA